MSAIDWARAAAVLLVIVISACRQAPPEKRLMDMWDAYRANYMSRDGYVRDPLRTGQVSSEAQSYALLQAAWLRDRATFDLVLRWTNARLKRPDGLYSWLFDPAGSGRIVDANTATDADTDIAFALIVAAATFDNPAYLDEARSVIRAVRTHAALPIRDGWFPSAGNWAAAERVVNLSYFAPYAYAYFDWLDAESGWPEAIDIGYQLLDAATQGTPARLPADFFSVTADGTPAALHATSILSRKFSYDGIRIAWRIEMDCRLRGEPRACAPQPLVMRLHELLARDGRLATRYSTEGNAESQDESLSFYGALLPASVRTMPHASRAWRTRFSDRTLNQLQRARNRYYDANWVWFGLALADDVVVARTPEPRRIKRFKSQIPNPKSQLPNPNSQNRNVDVLLTD